MLPDEEQVDLCIRAAIIAVNSSSRSCTSVEIFSLFYELIYFELKCFFNYQLHTTPLYIPLFPPLCLLSLCFQLAMSEPSCRGCQYYKPSLLNNSLGCADRLRFEWSDASCRKDLNHCMWWENKTVYAAFCHSCWLESTYLWYVCGKASKCRHLTFAVWLCLKSVGQSYASFTWKSSRGRFKALSPQEMRSFSERWRWLFSSPTALSSDSGLRCCCKSGVEVKSVFSSF